MTMTVMIIISAIRLQSTDWDNCELHLHTCTCTDSCTDRYDDDVRYYNDDDYDGGDDDDDDGDDDDEDDGDDDDNARRDLCTDGHRNAIFFALLHHGDQ